MKRCWIIVKKAAAVSLNSRAARLFFQVARFKVLRQHVGAVGVFTSSSCDEQDVPRSPPTPPLSCAHLFPLPPPPPPRPDSPAHIPELLFRSRAVIQVMLTSQRNNAGCPVSAVRRAVESSWARRGNKGTARRNSALASRVLFSYFSAGFSRMEWSESAL